MSHVTLDPECTCLLDIPTSNCAQCSNKGSGFTCPGCCEPFCPEHAGQHRAKLESDLSSLIRKTDESRLDVTVGDFGAVLQPIRKKIEDWRRESHQKIDANAEKLLDLLNRVEKYPTMSATGTEVDQLKACHKRFRKRLHEAQQLHNFDDRHLRYWQVFLEDLTANFRGVSGGDINLYECETLVKALCICGNIGKAKIQFSKWCEYQRPCLQVVDVRKTGEYREGNCRESVQVRQCHDNQPTWQSPPQPIHHHQPTSPPIHHHQPTSAPIYTPPTLPPCPPSNYYRPSDYTPSRRSVTPPMSGSSRNDPRRNRSRSRTPPRPNNHQ